MAYHSEEIKGEVSGKPAPDVTKAALEILRSQDFFAQLRGALARGGLAGEEKYGMVIYFVMISRFRPNPLRLALLARTDGDAAYVVRCVSRLFEPGAICGVCPEPVGYGSREIPHTGLLTLASTSHGVSPVSMFAIPPRAQAGLECL